MAITAEFLDGGDVGGEDGGVGAWVETVEFGDVVGFYVVEYSVY